MSDQVLHPLLALVKDRNLIDDLQLEEVIQEQARSGKSFSQVLADFQLVDTDTQLQIIAEQLSTEVVDLDNFEINPEVLHLVPPATARMYQAMPIAEEGSVLKVAIVDPLNNHQAVDELAYICGREIQLVVADEAAMAKLISRHFGEDSETVTDILKELGADTEIAKEVSE